MHDKRDLLNVSYNNEFGIKTRDINSRNNQSGKTKVTFLAKTKTAIQMLTILMYLFGLTINNMMVLFFADIMLIIALLVTIQTGFQYTISTFKK